MVRIFADGAKGSTAVKNYTKTRLPHKHETSDIRSSKVWTCLEQMHRLGADMVALAKFGIKHHHNSLAVSDEANATFGTSCV